MYAYRHQIRALPIPADYPRETQQLIRSPESSTHIVLVFESFRFGFCYPLFRRTLDLLFRFRAAHVRKSPVQFSHIGFLDLDSSRIEISISVPKVSPRLTAILVASLSSCNLKIFSIPKSSPLLALSPCTPSKYLVTDDMSLIRVIKFRHIPGLDTRFISNRHLLLLVYLASIYQFLHRTRSKKPIY